MHLLIASGTVELILVSILNPELGKEWPEFDVTLKGLFVSLTFIGEIIGGIIWGFISDKYGKQSPIISGRKIVFKTTALVSSIFGLASAFAPNPAVMLVLRFFLGVAIGGNLSIDVIFFMEFLPAHKRGKQTVTIILCGIGGCIKIFNN